MEIKNLKLTLERELVFSELQNTGTETGKIQDREMDLCLGNGFLRTVLMAEEFL